VGFETADDAGIYRLTDELAIITTADYITPPVADGYLYGQIAAANAISDVYAMGGRPITCLNLVSFPSKKLDPEILHQIISGALNKITEAGAVLAGGHSIEDDEPKFGLAVPGIVHPSKYWTNGGALPGDVLILTKPIGSGVLFNANLKNWVSQGALNACVDTLVTLNKTAAEVLQAFDVHAVTDVTGFGLAGHGFEVAKASNVKLIFDLDTVPIMAESLDMYRKGMNTGVNAFNRKIVDKYLRFEKEIPAWHQEIVFDPQTSGGLLAAVPGNLGQSILKKLHAKGVSPARIIGRVESSEDGPFILIN
jgi:selenide,water dikinase